MVKALVDKFHPMDNGAIQALMSSMQNLQLLDNEDLSVYKDKLENLNLQLSWVGQGMPESYLIHLAQSQLKKSRYGKDIEAIQISNTASGTSFWSLHDFFLGLERLDRLCGLPYGGAAISKVSNKIFKKPYLTTTSPGLVSSVQEDIGSPLELHSEVWVGAINLDEEHVKILRSLFKCPLCRTNTHTFPSCPLLKNWVLKKKVWSDNGPDIFTTDAVRSALATSLENVQESQSSQSGGNLSSIPEESSPDEDFDSDVEYDLLDGISSDNDFSGAVYPYSVLKVPLGLVKSASASRLVSQDHNMDYSSFDVIIDSGCTQTHGMFQGFIHYL